MSEDLLNVKRVAERLALEVQTVRKLVRRGELPAYRVCGVYRFMETDIQAYLERNRCTGERARRGKGTEAQ